VHKLRFAVKPNETLRRLSVGALGFTALFTVLNIIPSDMDLVPQLGLVFFNGEETQLPLGNMYPWKFIGLIGLMLVGAVVVALYLRAAATGFHWGNASRWSQYALIACAVTVILTMVTMGYTRETARRVDNDPGYLIYKCITLDQRLTPETCPVEGLEGET
jgi:cytochrome bd ubiquinol oxidase subunit I